MHATAVTASQSIARSSACVQWPAVTTVVHTPSPLQHGARWERNDIYAQAGLTVGM